MTSSETRIEYRDSAEGIEADMLEGFFVGWPNPPTPQRHLELLRRCQHRVVAWDPVNQRVVGFVTALSDGVFSAFIPLLEVLPELQGQGIGKALMQHILEQLRTHYSVDLLCDAELQPFYEGLGMTRGTGMLLRRFEFQNGQAIEIKGIADESSDS